jgi:Uma2 family endonuclease
LPGALMTIADTDIHRFTRAEYEQMAAMGLFVGKRVELIAGEVLDMPPQTNVHALGIMVMNRFLTRHLGDEFLIRCQLPLSAAEDHAPEPDFAVLRGNLSEIREHPQSALFVAEISFDSLKRDRDKAEIYAQARVAEYWIINLNARELIQHTLPREQVMAKGTLAGYASVRTFRGQDVVSCTALPLPVKTVEELLPPF